MDFYEREKIRMVFFPYLILRVGIWYFSLIYNTEVGLLVIFPYLILKVCFSKITQKGVRYWSWRNLGPI